ncbi:MAG: hypothetical protein Q4G59_13120, partial [Planctomycetia bacterium]|nr:hypothetical protein [Planctomycetia bacterium]
MVELRVKSLVITRQANLDKELIALQEYVYGTFEQEWIKLENKLYENQQTFRSKGDLRRYRQRMVQMGYSTNILLDNYTASWEDARNNVYKSIWDQNVLLKHSSESKIATIIGAIDMWTAGTNNATAVEKIRHYYVCKAKFQLESCTITAPCDGPIVYANQLVRVHHRSEANMIREGGAVMSGQLLFRIPGSDQIHIQTLINETDISALQSGMTASL